METSTPLRLTILGAGVTGTGIAGSAVLHGIPVVLIDVRQQALEHARAQIERRCANAAAAADPKAPAAGPASLLTSRAYGAGAKADMVVEAVTESAVAKTRAFAQAGKVFEPGVPFISCSSGIPISELADWSGRPFDLVGAHFANPAFRSRKVEIARGRYSGEHAVAAVHRLVDALGLRPVTVWDGPGMIGARLQYPLINAAAGILGGGPGGAEAVDEAMIGCYGHAVGPLRAADLIGIDSLVNTLDEIYTRTGDEACRPCGVLLDKVREGALGLKAGRGFYEYS